MPHSRDRAHEPAHISKKNKKKIKKSNNTQIMIIITTIAGQKLCSMSYILVKNKKVIAELIQ